LQEREALKTSGWARAASQKVADSVPADGRGAWVTLSRPGAKRALGQAEGGGAMGGDSEMQVRGPHLLSGQVDGAWG
jgi:hypothetical protein